MTSFIKTKSLVAACLMPLLATFLLATSKTQFATVTPVSASAQTQAPIQVNPQTNNQEPIQEIAPQTDTYTLGIEIADPSGQLSSQTQIEVSDIDGRVFMGNYTDYTQWLTNDKLSAGTYYIVLTPPLGTYSTIDNNNDQEQYALTTTAPNIYTVTLNQANLSNKPLVLAAFQLHDLDSPQAPTQAVTIEIRDLTGQTTSDSALTLYGPDGSQHLGEFDPQLQQWTSHEALLPGTYTIQLAPPSGTVSEIDTSANQQAIQTSTPNTYIITIDEQTAPYAAFQLTEIPTATYQLTIETTDENGNRTQIPVTVTDQSTNEMPGTYDAKDLWQSQDRLTEGDYTLTLTPQEDMTTQVDNSLMQFAEPTDKPNTYTLTINQERYTSTATLYAAFVVKEEAKISHSLGLEVRDLNNQPTASATISVTTSQGHLIEGSYDENNQWTAATPLAPGDYIIQLETPFDTQAALNETMLAFTQAEADPNRFRLTLNKDTYGVFNLVPMDPALAVESEVQTFEAVNGDIMTVEGDEVTVATESESTPVDKNNTIQAYIGVEVRSLEGLPMDEVEVILKDASGQQYTGTYNETLQWLSQEMLPEGRYSLELTTPAGTQAVINTMAPQLAVASEQVNRFTVDITQENLQNREAIFGAFRLVKAQTAELPQTGESLPVALALTGLLSLVIGLIILFRYQKAQ